MGGGGNRGTKDREVEDWGGKDQFEKTGVESTGHGTGDHCN